MSDPRHADGGGGVERLYVRLRGSAAATTAAARARPRDAIAPSPARAGLVASSGAASAGGAEAQDARAQTAATMIDDLDDEEVRAQVHILKKVRRRSLNAGEKRVAVIVTMTEVLGLRALRRKKPGGGGSGRPSSVGLCALRRAARLLQRGTNTVGAAVREFLRDDALVDTRPGGRYGAEGESRATRVPDTPR